MVDRVHALAVVIVLCLVVVVFCGVFWHLWHSWGNLLLGVFFVIGTMAFIFRNAIREL